MIILKNKKLFPFFLGLIIYSTSHSDSFEIQLVENDVKEFVINKNFQKDYIIYYKTEISNETYTCKTDFSGKIKFHVKSPIPKNATVINVFSETDDELRYHIISKKNKEILIDLLINDGTSNPNIMHVSTISKDEKLINMMQMGDHTLVFTKLDDAKAIFIYNIDMLGVIIRKEVKIRSNIIRDGIEKFGLQDMSRTFNPAPMASANSACKMYLDGDNLIITVDYYSDKEMEFIHQLEKINIKNDTYIQRERIIPTDRKIQETASAVLNNNIYFLSKFKKYVEIDVTSIEGSKKYGILRLNREMVFENGHKDFYIIEYPKDKTITSTKSNLDKKTYKQLFIGNPRISVTELDNKNIQIVLGSFYGTSGTFLKPDISNPISILVSTAIFAASSAIRSSNQINGVERYMCFNFKDDKLIKQDYSNQTSLLEEANNKIIEFNNVNKRGLAWLLHSNNESYLILKNKKTHRYTIHNL